MLHLFCELNVNEMEYASISREKANKYQEEKANLKGRHFTDKESGERCIVVSVLVLPSEVEILMKLTGLIALYHAGVRNLHEQQRLAERYTEDKFTVVIFGQTVSLSVPSVVFQPLCQLVNNNGEMELGFPIDFEE